MLELKVNGKLGLYEVKLPTSLNEISEQYLYDVTNHVNVAPNYSLIGLVFRERLSTLILAARKNSKKSDVSVIPVFIKSNGIDKQFNHIALRDRLIIAPSDIMMGYHISAPNNFLTINTILDIIDGDPDVYTQALNIKDECYFIEFKLVPNCNIHGYYSNLEVAEFVSPFVTKLSDAKTSTIIVPSKSNIIV